MKKLCGTVRSRKGRINRHRNTTEYQERKQRFFENAEATQEVRKMMAMSRLFKPL